MNQRNTAASVRARLLNRARETRQDFNLVLTRYALERLLYRLSVSPHADQFLLKGALLFDLWFDIPQRPTRDADFLGFGSAELPHLEAVFKDVCAMETDDGVTFRSDTVQAAEIRKEANYAGVRVTLLGLIDGARCQRSRVASLMHQRAASCFWLRWTTSILVSFRMSWQESMKALLRPRAKSIPVAATPADRSVRSWCCARPHLIFAARHVQAGR
jgi:hypothetical protein